VLAQPLPAEYALDPAELAAQVSRAEAAAAAVGVAGPARTPFLLRHLAESTGGRALRANQALVTANSRLAASVAVALAAGG
jgi:pseudouridine-5'-phosphate glycosidase